MKVCERCGTENPGPCIRCLTMKHHLGAIEPRLLEWLEDVARTSAQREAAATLAAHVDDVHRSR